MELLDGPNVFAGMLVEFVQRVRDKLYRPTERPNKPFLYIVADTSDWNLARELQAAALKVADVDVMTSSKEGRVQDFEGAIKLATAIIFVHGAASTQFIEGWLKVYVRKMRSLNHSPPLVALYRAPPPKTPDEEPLIPLDELRTFGSSEKFTTDGIREILKELSRENDRHAIRGPKK
jgi:hypothetical protein